MKNIDKKDLLVEEWLKKAEDDRLFAQAIMQDENAPPSGVCFHAQQMAEKLLKAFIVYHSQRYPRIHPVDALWELCYKLDVGFQKVKEEAAFLTKFYIETRYPGDYPDFTKDDAQKAYDAALRIKEFVLKNIDMV